MVRDQEQSGGLPGAEAAHRATVSAAAISHALNRRRIHPAKLRAIAIELDKVEPVPGADALVDDDQDAARARETADHLAAGLGRVG